MKDDLLISLVYIFENDLLTGVRSRNSYEEICDEFLQQAEKMSSASLRT